MKTISPFVLLLSAGLASGQTSPTAPESEPVHLENFVVSASPHSRAQDEIAQPTSVLAGQRLTWQRQGTLGETLAQEPGISRTYFGPGASRPVIRGLGGDRIRVLTGGIGTLDASIISPDHAISLDPLLIERVEIVRGPATLLYGGSAIGGVVNVIDGRIPEAPPAAPVSGRFETRFGSAADERAVAGLITGRAGAFVWRLDGFSRRTDDVRIPGFAETSALLADHDEDEEGPPAQGRLPNSATDTQGGAAALSWIGERGHLGMSYRGFDSFYGVPGHAHDEEEEAGHEEDGEEGVRIDLRQRRWDVHGELFSVVPLVKVARLQLGVADYEHNELEGAEIGTRFTNRAYEGRLELLHEPLGRWEGAIGAQVSRSDLAATGDEAFVPPAVTTNRALFVYEELPGAKFTWQLGGRVEKQRVTPDANTGLAARSHDAVSASAGLIWKGNDSYSVALSLARSERAPNGQELFADGPHAGTGAYEIGDPQLGVERAHSFDLSLRKRAGLITGAATVFATRFEGYIFEEPTGATEDGLPVYQFVQRDAEFRGAELELVAHLHESAGHQADLRFVADHVRAEDRRTGEPLPRITPVRLGWAFDYRVNRLSLTAEVRTTGRQDRIAANETITGGYSLINVYATWRWTLGGADAELFFRGTNLGDQTARVHTSFLKDVAPLPGRDFTAGLRVAF